MKIKQLYLIILLFILINACQISSIYSDLNTNKTSSILRTYEKRSNNFKEKTITGKIGGINCHYESGTAEDFNSREIIINIYLKNSISNTQNTKNMNYDVIGLYVPKEIGKTTLAPTSQSITLIDGSENMNYICLHGNIEILQIDSNKIFGRLAAYYNSQNFVSGHFDLKFIESE